MLLPLKPENRIFCSFAYTGQDPDAVKRRMGIAVATLRNIGMQDVYCNLEDERVTAFKLPLEFVDAAVEEVKRSKYLLAVKTLGFSVGQICEMDTARQHGIPIIYAEHTDAAVETSYLRDFAQHLFPWTTEADLAGAIQTLRQG